MSEIDQDEIDLILKLSLDEINIILKSLSKEPFKDVFELIGKINEQASGQLNHDKT